MSDSESDIEIKTALPKKIPKKTAPRSPSDDLNLKDSNKKVSTKTMIIDALTELKTRKGVSLYAIKKFLTEKYNVNTEKVNYLIKKSIKSGVEDGTFVRMKGIGASGSFKLANVTEKPKKKKKIPKKPAIEKTDNAEKTNSKKSPKKMDIKKAEKPKPLNKVKKPKEKDAKKKEKGDLKEIKEIRPKKVEKVEKSKKVAKNEETKKKTKTQTAKGKSTPAKKRAAMMNRKSIGSIIKPPKIKPKSKA